MLSWYRQRINPPYSKKDIPAFVATFLILFLIPFVVIALQKSEVLFGQQDSIQSTSSSKVDSTPPITFSFGAAGDHGTAIELFDLVKDTDVDFYLALGDLSYKKDGEKEWCGEFKSRFNNVEIIAGNHDSGESSGGNINVYTQHCPFTLDKLTGDYGKQYYFDYPQRKPLARFIMITPGVKGSLNIDYGKGGAGYIFTEDAIDGARSAGTPWVIVGMHENCITTATKECSIGTDLFNLLISKKVDLVLQGHEHNYQRSKQLGHSSSCFVVNPKEFDSNCVVDDGLDNIYSKSLGSVLIIAGTGGRSLYEIDTASNSNKYFAKWSGKNVNPQFGFVKYEVSNKQITAEFLGPTPQNFSDKFWIKKTSR